MTEDPIVAEVREARKKLEAMVGIDFMALYKQMVALQNQYAYRLVTSPLPIVGRDFDVQKLTVQH